MGGTGCPCSPGRSEWCRRDPAGRGGSGEDPPTTTILRNRHTGHEGTSHEIGTIINNLSPERKIGSDSRKAQALSVAVK